MLRILPLFLFLVSRPLTTGNHPRTEASDPSSLLPINLLTEYRTNPFGIDTALPRFSWSLTLPSYELASNRSFVQIWYQIQVFMNDATNILIWDSNQVYSNQSFLIPFNGTVPLQSDTTYIWWVRIGYLFLNFSFFPSSSFSSSPLQSPFSAPSTFHTALYSTKDWQGIWISGPTDENMFRTTFTLPSLTNKSLASASLFGTGLGYVEFYMNNQRIGDALRKQDPGWTSYAHRVRYVSFDITPYILSSADSFQTLGIMIGNGWFNCEGWYKQPPYPYPSATNGGGFCYDTSGMILAQITLRFTDNTTMNVFTEVNSTVSPWYSAHGPVSFDSIYDGEWYNSTVDSYFNGWLTNNYTMDFSLWRPVIAATGPATLAPLSAQRMEPVKVVESRSPVTYWSYDENTMVFDFGRNNAGVLRVQLPPGAPGQTVTFQHAETLTHEPYGPADGSLYTAGLRNAHSTDNYIMNGDPAGETYEPRFTWHGFRYASVTNAPGPLTPDQVTYQIQHNDVRINGEITFGSAVLEAIQAAVTTSIVSNLQWGPGSCTNRDERQFFTGDTGLGAEVSLLNYQLGELYSDWIDTVTDQQNTDGSVGYYAPIPLTDTRDGSPNWITGFPTAVYLVWWHYGDTRIIQNNFGALQRYITFLQGKYNSTGPGLSNYWDEGPTEWVNLGPNGNNHLINAFALIHDIIMMVNMSNAINEITYANELNVWLTTLQTEFYTAFYNVTNGCYGFGTQTEQVLSLYIQAYPDISIGQTVINFLVNDIMNNQNGHILTGIIGTRFIFEVLSRFGYTDVSFQVLQNTSYPGYGWMVLGVDNPEPATSLWEEWNSDIEDAIMASRNHLMFSSVGAWFYQRLGGIMPLTPGYATVSIFPLYVNDKQLTFMSTSLNTLYGWIRVSWSVSNRTVPNAPILCGNEEEANAPLLNYVTLSCGSNSSNITNVTFASFGTPVGSCANNEFTTGACNAPSSLAIVESFCLNRSNCSIPVAVSTFGNDPCEGTKKNLAVIVTCNNQSNIPSTVPQLLMNITLPYGTGISVVTIPLSFTEATGSFYGSYYSTYNGTVTISESGIIVWENNTYQPNRVPGILRGELVSYPVPGVAFQVTSGSYAFVSDVVG